jgi:DNA-binding CsgD family transcriptional regulator
MAGNAETAIALTETAYDLREPDNSWLRRLVETGLPLLDEGCGVVGVAYVRTDPGTVGLARVDIVAGPKEFPERKMKMMAEASPEMMRALTHPGIVGTVSHVLRNVPGGIELWQKHFDWMSDALGLTAMDPDGQGIVIVAGRRGVGTLNRVELQRWQRVSVHFSAGHRIRRGLATSQGGALPLQSEAVIDPASFAVTDAVASARAQNVVEKLRFAAKQIDKARSNLRRTDPDLALEIWQGLVEGRWSLVDWFDTDGRRYIVARPNSPALGDPRGLSDRELQVATYASLGESSKLIGYRLGIAPSTVSEQLKAAMRKLGVETQLQLIQKIRGFDIRASTGSSH